MRRSPDIEAAILAKIVWMLNVLRDWEYRRSAQVFHAVSGALFSALWNCARYIVASIHGRARKPTSL
jgi:hypothetical protein